jgi:hypothetical protein
MVTGTGEVPCTKSSQSVGFQAKLRTTVQSAHSQYCRAAFTSYRNLRRFSTEAEKPDGLRNHFAKPAA